MPTMICRISNVRFFKTIISGFCLVAMLVSQWGGFFLAYPAQIPLPTPSKQTIISALGVSQPQTNLVGMKFDQPQDSFEFIFDPAGNQIDQAESERIINYFLAALTIPRQELWVNLSPYEPERIVDDPFSYTDFGKELLEEDYVLKQVSALLTSPDSETGKIYWSRLRQETKELLGSDSAAQSALSKVWIVPSQASVYEENGYAYVNEARFKVMLDEDYFAAQQQNNRSTFNVQRSTNKATVVEQRTLNSERNAAVQIMREVLIPRIEQEVNTGANFKKLRQMYQALILAVWFKRHYQDNDLSGYFNSAKTAGIEVKDRNVKLRIFDQYVLAYKTGAYSYLRRETDSFSGKKVFRKYFAGGCSMDPVYDSLREIKSSDPQAASTRANIFSRAGNLVKLTAKAIALKNGRQKPFSSKISKSIAAIAVVGMSSFFALKPPEATAAPIDSSFNRPPATWQSPNQNNNIGLQQRYGASNFLLAGPSLNKSNDPWEAPDQNNNIGQQSQSAVSSRQSATEALAHQYAAGGSGNDPKFAALLKQVKNFLKDGDVSSAKSLLSGFTQDSGAINAYLKAATDFFKAQAEYEKAYNSQWQGFNENFPTLMQYFVEKGRLPFEERQDSSFILQYVGELRAWYDKNRSKVDTTLAKSIDKQEAAIKSLAGQIDTISSDYFLGREQYIPLFEDSIAYYSPLLSGANSLLIQKDTALNQAAADTVPLSSNVNSLLSQQKILVNSIAGDSAQLAQVKGNTSLTAYYQTQLDSAEAQKSRIDASLATANTALTTARGTVTAAKNDVTSATSLVNGYKAQITNYKNLLVVAQAPTAEDARNIYVRQLKSQMHAAMLQIWPAYLTAVSATFEPGYLKALAANTSARISRENKYEIKYSDWILGDFADATVQAAGGLSKKYDKLEQLQEIWLRAAAELPEYLRPIALDENECNDLLFQSPSGKLVLAGKNTPLGVEATAQIQLGKVVVNGEPVVFDINGDFQNWDNTDLANYATLKAGISTPYDHFQAGLLYESKTINRPADPTKSMSSGTYATRYDGMHPVLLNVFANSAGAFSLGHFIYYSPLWYRNAVVKDTLLKCDNWKQDDVLMNSLYLAFSPSNYFSLEAKGLQLSHWMDWAGNIIADSLLDDPSIKDVKADNGFMRGLLAMSIQPGVYGFQIAYKPQSVNDSAYTHSLVVTPLIINSDMFKVNAGFEYDFSDPERRLTGSIKGTNIFGSKLSFSFEIWRKWMIAQYSAGYYKAQVSYAFPNKSGISVEGDRYAEGAPNQWVYGNWKVGYMFARWPGSSLKFGEKLEYGGKMLDGKTDLIKQKLMAVLSVPFNLPPKAAKVDPGILKGAVDRLSAPGANLYSQFQDPKDTSAAAVLNGNTVVSLLSPENFKKALMEARVTRGIGSGQLYVDNQKVVVHPVRGEAIISELNKDCFSTQFGAGDSQELLMYWPGNDVISNFDYYVQTYHFSWVMRNGVYTLAVPAFSKDMDGAFQDDYNGSWWAAVSIPSQQQEILRLVYAGCQIKGNKVLGCILYPDGQGRLVKLLTEDDLRKNSELIKDSYVTNHGSYLWYRDDDKNGVRGPAEKLMWLSKDLLPPANEPGWQSVTQQVILINNSYRMIFLLPEGKQILRPVNNPSQQNPDQRHGSVGVPTNDQRLSANDQTNGGVDLRLEGNSDVFSGIADYDGIICRIERSEAFVVPN